MKLFHYPRLMVVVIAATFIPVNSHGSTTSLLEPQKEHYRATRLITHILDKYHYKDFSIDDALSEKILDEYIQTLDPGRSYFYQKDINSFQAFEFELDDALNHSELSMPFQMFHLYQKRVNERIVYALDLLDKEFDFTINEELATDRSRVDWAIDEEELNEIWRKRIKNDVLTLKLADKDPGEIRETLEKRYKNIAKRVRQIDAEDTYQLFINAFTNTLDPHTTYLSPRSSDNFAIKMSLSLEGIGALLSMDDDYTVVKKIIPGGPADLSNLLHASDRIVGIAQQNEEEFVDVVGWRLDNVVELIRGAKDTVVKLQILPGVEGRTAKIREIQITRDKIRLEEQAAKGKAIEIHDGNQAYKIGVIDVPTFYTDLVAYQRGGSNYRSTTRDVDNIITELKSENIDALVLDLRGNGGGSLTEAVQLTGLFIDEGPVVQVQNSNSRIEVHRDRDSDVSYQGPLVVLIDRFSASASEIVAGAIQDYQRGIVVGEPTFGKGTVQQLFDLNRFRSSRGAKLGQLKATIAQYFRVNGDSTQHRGVTPDIDFNTYFADKEYGERALKNALPWGSLSPVTHYYGAVDAQVIESIFNLHKLRVEANEEFNSLIKILHFDHELRSQKTISLLESARRKEYERVESTRSTYQDLFQSAEDDLGDVDSNEEHVNTLLDEAAHIAADLSRLLQSKSSGSFVSRDH